MPPTKPRVAIGFRRPICDLDRPSAYGSAKKQTWHLQNHPMLSFGSLALASHTRRTMDD